MDRGKPYISVVPQSVKQSASGPRIVESSSAEWDAQWLHPQRRETQSPARVNDVPAQWLHPQQSETQSPVREKDAPAQAEKSDPLTIRFLRWLFPEVNQRRAKRYATPNLVAYYWTGGAPYSYHVGDISATGLFLLTKERWAPGTLIQMTLQKQDGRMNSHDSSICLLSEVVRWSENGAGFNFVLTDYENVENYAIHPNEAVDRKSVERFLQKIGLPASR